MVKFHLGGGVSFERVFYLNKGNEEKLISKSGNLCEGKLLGETYSEEL